MTARRSPHAECLDAFGRVREEAVDVDALAGNLFQLLDGLPDIDELPAERDQEDLARIVQQARILCRSARYLVATVDDHVAKLLAVVTPPILGDA